LMTPTEHHKLGQENRLATKKVFHVSPFLDLNYNYLWSLSVPDSELTVRIDNQRTTPGSLPRDFHASLHLRRIELTCKSLSRTLIQYPWMTLKVYLAIYWQAFRLWQKNVAYVPHPNVNQLTKQSMSLHD